MTSETGPSGERGQYPTTIRVPEAVPTPRIHPSNRSRVLTSRRYPGPARANQGDGLWQAVADRRPDGDGAAHPHDTDGTHGTAGPAVSVAALMTFRSLEYEKGSTHRTDRKGSRARHPGPAFLRTRPCGGPPSPEPGDACREVA